jgi:hypothetical protein
MIERPKIKGAGIREFFKWYLDKFGPDYVAARLAQLPEEVRQQIVPNDPHLGVEAGEWYPAELVHALLDSAALGMSPNDRKALMREGAQAALKSTLRGIYKLVFDVMATPDRYARRAHGLFSRYFNTGTMTKIVESPGAHLSLIHDWGSHHPLLCDFVQYTAETVYGAMGCKNVVSTRLSCISHGGEFCSFRVTWANLR